MDSELAFFRLVVNFLFIGFISLSAYWLFKFVKQAKLKRRLKKLDLAQYEVMCSFKGKPTILQRIDDKNELIYL